MRSRGFTLVELLVVISIIGLLASVVLASLSAARGRGQIGAGITFATHMYQAMGLSAVGTWNFNEGGTDIAGDLTGNGVALTLANGITRGTDTPSGSGYSLELHNLSTAEMASAEIPERVMSKLPQGYTMSVWMKVVGHTGSQTIVPFAVTGSAGGGHFISYNVDSKVAQCYTDFFPSDMANAPMSEGVWHYVTCSMDPATREQSLYIDGKLVDKKTLMFQDLGVISPVNVYVGNDNEILANIPWTGFVDDPVFYTKAMSAAWVQRQYVDSLEKHTLAISK